MSRRPRPKSTSGIYHIILRGINRQEIFWEEEDFQHFLYVMQICKNISHFTLFAYCLMSNHIHLLIQTADEPIDLVLKRIETRFVYWYNLKYERIGHLFQDRYKSQTVETDAAFLRVLRYIIQNPMKAGLELIPGTYRWSSFFNYFEKSGSLVDTSYVNSQFSSADELKNYLCQKNTDTEMETSDPQTGCTDEAAASLMKKITGCSSGLEFREFSKKEQKKYLQLFRRHSFSYGQISRLTGMPKTTIYRICLNK